MGGEGSSPPVGCVSGYKHPNFHGLSPFCSHILSGCVRVSRGRASGGAIIVTVLQHVIGNRSWGGNTAGIWLDPRADSNDPLSCDGGTPVVVRFAARGNTGERAAIGERITVLRSA
jgi:hypothetical protein